MIARSDILLCGDAANSLQGNKLLAYANKSESFVGDADAWLCRAFGAAQPQLAALSALGDGLDVSSGYWLQSDPVHLALMRDFAVLQGTPPDITPQQTQDLVAALNQHFADDGLQWFAPHPQRWYLRVNHAPEPINISKNAALGRRMEKQTSTPKWAAVLNEIQMLLHQHPVNEAREHSGLLPVNSVWLFGGGAYVAPTLQPYAAVMANTPLLRGLAGERCQPLPDSAEFLTENSLAVLDDLQAAQQWLAALWGMLKKEKVQTLHLHLEQEPTVNSFLLCRQDLWKFWRGWLA